MDVLLVLAILSLALVAGFFYGWSVSAVLGLADVSDREYVSVMQSINRAILNPGFLGAFMGAPLLLAAATAVHFIGEERTAGWWLAGATTTYLLAVFGVTVAGNVPLNNQLDEFELEAADPEAVARQRHDYETAWNRWHTVRSVASVVALTMAVVAALSLTR